MSALLTELLAKRRRLDERIKAEVARIEAGEITADAVVVATADLLEVPLGVILSKTRTSRIVKARWVAAKVLRDGLMLSLPQEAEVRKFLAELDETEAALLRRYREAA